MGTPRAAGFVAGSWCWAAATLAINWSAPAAPWGSELLGWLASDGLSAEMLPIAVAVLVGLVHASLVRQAEDGCCRAWIDAACSLAAVAAGIGAWTWALRYEPFADPLSASRRLAALAGMGAMLVGTGMTVAAAAMAPRAAAPARRERAFRPSYEAFG
ncbi:MAG: hypothetical protein ACREOF_03955 [Gemmatimonadales bacterium]